MSFTYLGDLSTDLDKLRFEIGDNVQGQGILPNGDNVPDETLSALLVQQGSMGAAAVRVAEVMVAHWRRMANISVGARNEELGMIADGWQKTADQLRAKYGGGPSMMVGGFRRVDGYHDMNTYSDDTAGEYVDSQIIFITG